MSRRSPSAVALQNASSDGLSVVKLTIESVVEPEVGPEVGNWVIDAVKSTSISNYIDIVAGYGDLARLYQYKSILLILIF
jgi:hypothetical protein